MPRGRRRAQAVMMVSEWRDKRRRDKRRSRHVEDVLLVCDCCEKEKLTLTLLASCRRRGRALEKEKVVRVIILSYHLCRPNSAAQAPSSNLLAACKSALKGENGANVPTSFACCFS